MPAVAARLRALTDRLAEGAAALGMAPRAGRAPHILGLRWPGGIPEGRVARLRARGVFVGERLGALPLSPHVFAHEASSRTRPLRARGFFAHEADLDRCLAALRSERAAAAP
ncbi:hypothetical protein [Methylobacterium soli]|uniref:Aminotransferase class V-fold PLP-dependent enzyme n=1 Tax=Methylobacterium soli TaxID=553447 RepID=A0A6L3SWB6_9HYPH|nr:hypothetical protein [Methylobacterium soli]KAB1078078.1 hypothetical protein F6X53_16410 [Methylobacterium soli]GJE42327.1 hypothetical protein AEGHOMDF_1499 [Methylobacterium soli]